MNLLRLVRRHLSLKLFLSYLFVVLIGMGVLSLALEAALPQTFERHMGMMAGMMGQGARQHQQLYAGFRAGASEALLLAGIVALFLASILSLIISQQLITPVQRMMLASQRIAEGHYDERVPVPGQADMDGLDELGRLALSFNQMADKLERTESMRRELIGDVAHELRTPLTSLKGYMEALMDGVLPAEPATYQRIYAEAERLQRLVQSLQELSRVEARAFDLKLEPLELGEAIADAVANLSLQFEEKGVALSSQCTPGQIRVLADKDRLQQVLLNLLGNALQYTPEGGHVEICAARQGDEAVVTIADSGIGIAPEHLPHLFDRFYRVDRSRSRASGGSGIGLTIAKHLVEAQGGHIWAESAGPGQGSRFSFTLPLAS